MLLPAENDDWKFVVIVKIYFLWCSFVCLSYGHPVFHSRKYFTSYWVDCNYDHDTQSDDNDSIVLRQLLTY